jgi:hypothetical protein
MLGALKHFASPDFWACYKALPRPVQELADKSFSLLKDDPHHPSLHFKKVGRYWSARVGLHHRALAVEVPGGVLWFWMGSHKDYDKLLS